MCRNIKTLHHFEPPATPDEVRASALQYVRKLSGMQTPSKANQAAFEAAVDAITETTLRLFDALVVKGPHRSRELEQEKADGQGTSIPTANLAQEPCGSRRPPMAARRQPSRQADLFPRSTRPVIAIDENHPKRSTGPNCH